MRRPPPIRRPWTGSSPAANERPDNGLGDGGDACTTGLHTHEPPAEVPEWMTGTLISEGIEDAVARAPVGRGQKNVGVPRGRSGHPTEEAR